MTFTPPDTTQAGAPRIPFQYGLLSVVSLRGDGQGRWKNGVEWESLDCDPASGLSANCDDPVTIGTDGTGVNLPQAAPFTIYDIANCGPIGRGSFEDAEERATEQLLVHEEARAEQAFWTGDLDNFPNLVNGGTDDDPIAAVTLGGGIVSAKEAVALLEDWNAVHYGSLGVIHVTRGGAVALIAAKVAEVKSGQLQTRIGTPVVAGAGYPGTSPAGAAPAAGSTWAFVSPAIFGYRSEVYHPSNRPGDLLDRDTNDMFAFAGRDYLLGFDPCGTAAVNFDLDA